MKSNTITKILSLTFILGLFTASFAQSKKSHHVTSPHYKPVSASLSANFQSEAQLQAVLLEQVFHQHEKLGLALKNDVTSLTARWIDYKFTYNGHAVIPSFMQVRVPKKNGKLEVDYSQIPLKVANEPFPAKAPLRNQLTQENYTIIAVQKVYLVQGDQLHPGLSFTVQQKERSFKITYNARGEQFLKEDLQRYHSHVKQRDTTISVQVFDPDPLTTARKNYGSPYVDNNDQFVQELDDEIVTRTTRGDVNNGLFSLKNPFVEIMDFSSPSIAPPTSSGNNKFHYGREQDAFEAVNAFYHITNYKEHINGLGFTQLPGEVIEVDANALNGSDNSFFNTFNKRISLGEGGVDDAEDADVIIHEYFHAMVWKASPDNNPNVERSNLEEGLCDYMAVSYSRQRGLFNADRMFSWDGHNEFWTGRFVSSSKDYKQISFGTNIYQHTDLIASVLIDLNQQIGRNTTEQLVTEATFGLLPTTRFDQFACLMLRADSILNNGNSKAAIKSSFAKRNVIACENGISLRENALDHPPIELRGSFDFLGTSNALIRAEGAKTIDAELYNILGQRVEQWASQGAELEMAAQALAPGVYLLKVKTNDRRERVFKVIRR
mgnify:CR=1 FL=1